MHARAHQVCMLSCLPGKRLLPRNTPAMPCCALLVARSVDASGEMSARPDCTHGMLSRFASKSQLQNFLRLPPCEAVSKQAEGVPLHAVLDFAYNVVPPTGTKNASPQSALL